MEVFCAENFSMETTWNPLLKSAPSTGILATDLLKLAADFATVLDTD